MFLFILTTLGYYGWGLYFGISATVLDCAYMTVISLTTVGYSEILEYADYPEVRIFTMVVVVIGIGSFLYLISAATAFIFDGELRGFLHRRRMDKAIKKLRGHFIICGVGQTGLYASEEFLKIKHQVVLIDKNEEQLTKVSEILGQDIPHLAGDATEDSILEEAGIQNAKGLFSALTDDKDNLFCVVTARTLNPSLRIVTRAVDQKAAEKLAKAGADRVVSTHFIGAMRMVSEMVRPQVVEFLDFMLQSQEGVVRIEEVRIGPKSSIRNQTLRKAELRRHGDLLVLAAYQPGTTSYQHNPGPDFVLEPGMVLVILGDVESVQSLRNSIL